MTDKTGRGIGMALLLASTVLVSWCIVKTLAWLVHRQEVPPEATVVSVPGPVEPQPRIEDHVAAVAQQECAERQECLTRDSLKRVYGIDIVCAEERYTGRQTNPSSAVAHVPCSRVTEVRMHGQSVWKGR